MSSAPGKIADLARRCKVLSEELKSFDLCHLGTNTEELIFGSSGNRRKISNERNERIQEIFNRRSLTTRGKTNLEDFPTAKRARQHEPEVVFPLLPSERYENVRPLPSSQKSRGI